MNMSTHRYRKIPVTLIICVTILYSTAQPVKKYDSVFVSNLKKAALVSVAAKYKTYLEQLGIVHPTIEKSSVK